MEPDAIQVVDQPTEAAAESTEKQAGESEEIFALPDEQLKLYRHFIAEIESAKTLYNARKEGLSMWTRFVAAELNLLPTDRLDENGVIHRVHPPVR